MKTELPTRCLSLRQPWAHAVIHGGKRIENRVKWKNSHVRGPILIHAAAGMTRKEYQDVIRFLCERHICREDWQPPPPAELQRGGIVGMATIIGVVRPVTIHGRIEARASLFTATERKLKPEEAQWWMGGFALVLADVQALPFTPCKGALGFFRAPPDVLKSMASLTVDAKEHIV